MIRIFKIHGETEETKSYTPSTFYIVDKLIYNDGFGYSVHKNMIVSENPVFGFMIREDMTINKLLDHLQNMKNDGFTITEETTEEPKQFITFKNNYRGA